MKSESKKELAEELIRSFSKEFYKVVGVYPLVSYSIRNDRMIRISLSEFEEVVNDVFINEYPEDYPLGGIRYKSRKRTLILFRQVYMSLAYEMGHTLTPIGKSIGFNHATVLHARKTVSDLLESKDSQLLEIYNKVFYAAKKRYGDDGNVQQDDGGEPISESVLPSVLHEGEHESGNNQHSSDPA